LEARFFFLVVLVLSVIDVTPYSVFERVRLHLPQGKQPNECGTAPAYADGINLLKKMLLILVQHTQQHGFCIESSGNCDGMGENAFGE
jgi:hypothetical protein